MHFFEIEVVVQFKTLLKSLQVITFHLAHIPKLVVGDEIRIDVLVILYQLREYGLLRKSLFELKLELTNVLRESHYAKHYDQRKDQGVISLLTERRHVTAVAHGSQCRQQQKRLVK